MTMRTTLLKQLRREARILYYNSTTPAKQFPFGVAKLNDSNHWLHSYKTFDEAVAKCNQLRRQYILDRINVMRFMHQNM